MTTELWLLFLSLPLYGLYLGAQSLIFRWKHGVLYAASARDEELPEGELLGRAERALKNFQETWLVYVVLILLAHLAMPGDTLIFWGAVVWGVARIAYLPLYLAGTFMVRSIVWNVSLIGLAMMVWGVLF
ncbi:MAG: MAPEG family protein [Devosia sp.]|uniref:MAPEG family protein n=1 Tax=Devosia sp. TaxID=1871048 RepID=UPI001A587135|nr:MAPEG family protein [Devosia sp.]MBL8599899.1 MAPEG family protein [Devosia sp.]